MKYIYAFITAFGCSALLYRLSHREQIPELARYGLGCLLIIAVLHILYGDQTTTERAFVAAAITGLGVGTNRVRMEFEES